jgi:hypothetical protein
MAQLGIISAKDAHYLIDALEGTMLACPAGNRLAQFTINGFAPLNGRLTAYTPTVDRSFWH